jgi:NADPH:quinone reductase-like Zn-dependent oxidoreductase
MGHEYGGVVEAVGGEVTTVKPGQFVVGSVFALDHPAVGVQPGAVLDVLAGDARRDPQGA